MFTVNWFPDGISYAVALSCGIYEIKVQLRLFDAFSKTKGNFLLACSLLLVRLLGLKAWCSLVLLVKVLWLPKSGPQSKDATSYLSLQHMTMDQLLMSTS